jgi:hypothetical protein
MRKINNIFIYINMLNRRSLARIVQEQNLMTAPQKKELKKEVSFSDLSPQEQLEDLLKMANSKKEKDQKLKRKKIIVRFLDLLKSQFPPDDSVDSIFH